MSNTITHIFWGHSWLLVSQMIEKIVRYSSFQHHFVIVLNRPNQKELYDGLFSKLKYSSFEYWELDGNKQSSDSMLHQYWLYVRLVFSGVFVRFKSIKKYLTVYKKVLQSNANNFIVHSEINDLFVLLLSKNVKIVWCNWGQIPERVPLGLSELFKKKYYYQKFFDKCYSIVVLTEADQKSFLENLGKKTKLASYSYIYNFDQLATTKSNSAKILVGNSACYLEEYLSFAKSCKSLKGADITFMCSYGADKESVFYKEWRSRVCQLLEENSIHFWEDDISIDEYNQKIATFDIYVAPMSRQSGIGAITTSLGSGLKCYLTGVNYDYFSRKGLIVCKYEDFFNNPNSVFDWDASSSLENIEKVRDVCGVNKSIKDWESIYSDLLK